MRGLRGPRTQLAAALVWLAASGPAFPRAGLSGAGPVLELAPPAVDQATLRVAVRLRNRGPMALAPAELIVRYTVTGVVRGARPTIAEGTFEAAGIAIPPAASVEIGHFVLPDPDRALSFEEVTIGLRVEPRRRERFEVVEASFPHRWQETTLAVTSAQLAALSVSFAVTLDNWRDGAGPRRSAVTLALGPRAIGVELDLPRACAVLPGGPGAPSRGGALLVAGLTAGPPGGLPVLSIRDGKLLVRAEVGSSSSDELRVAPAGAGRPDASARTVADVRPFAVEVELVPAVSTDRRRLSYGHLPAVRVGEIAPAPAGGTVCPQRALEEAVEQCIRRPLTRQLRVVFDRDDVRAAMEELLAAASAGRRISFVRRVTGRGDTVLVTYV